MKLFARKRAPEAEAPPPPSFGPWMVEQFAQGRPTQDMTFAELERLCANAASLLCGAAFAEPEAMRGRVAVDTGLTAEANLVARRTGEGFKACLADREHTVITWPWDHLATRVAWQATQAGDTAEEVIGRRLFDIGASYALRHRDQLASVITLWTEVAAGVRQGDDAPPDLPAMGQALLRAFEVERAAAAAAR